MFSALSHLVPALHTSSSSVLPLSPGNISLSFPFFILLSCVMLYISFSWSWPELPWKRVQIHGATGTARWDVTALWWWQHHFMLNVQPCGCEVTKIPNNPQYMHHINRSMDFYNWLYRKLRCDETKICGSGFLDWGIILYIYTFRTNILLSCLQPNILNTSCAPVSTANALYCWTSTFSLSLQLHQITTSLSLRSSAISVASVDGNSSLIFHFTVTSKYSQPNAELAFNLFIVIRRENGANIYHPVFE